MSGIKLGVIGTGGVARAHARRLVGMEGVAFAALADPSAESMAAFMEIIEGHHTRPAEYDDYRDMLAGEDLDAVLVASPHTMHFAQIMDSLDAGLHVLAEKPMVCSTEEALQVCERAADADGEVVVAYQRRWDERYLYFRRFVCSPEFGRLLTVSAFQSQAWLTRVADTWRQDPALSGGGQLNDSGSHLVDFLLWSMPHRVTDVSARIENRGTAVDIDAAVTFATDGGAIGTLTIMGSAPHGGMQEDVYMNGDGGRSVFLRPDRFSVTRELHGPFEEVEEFDGVTGSSPDEHFLAVVRGERNNESPPEDFVRVMQFTEACWQSAANGGQPVCLPVA